MHVMAVLPEKSALLPNQRVGAVSSASPSSPMPLIRGGTRVSRFLVL